MDGLVKMLSERKRRTFLRFMKKGRPMNEENRADVEETKEFDADGDEVTTRTVPHTREELMRKIEELQKEGVGEDGDEDDDDDEFNDSDLDEFFN